MRPVALDLPKLWLRGRGAHGRLRLAIPFILCAVVGIVHLDGVCGFGGLFIISCWVYDCILDLEGPVERCQKGSVILVKASKSQRVNIFLSPTRISVKLQI